MKTVTSTKFREYIYHLIDEISNSHEPLKITGKRNNAVLVSEEDWNSIQETLYLLNIPGMKESIIDGSNESIDECIGEDEIWNIE
jgi:PHD/YefM family antitoxin component YafN of YafNO toxin-antitoxin module